MADLKLLVPELNEAETMSAETARFEELLLQVRTERTPGSLRIWEILCVCVCVCVCVWCVCARALRNGTTVPRMYWRGAGGEATGPTGVVVA